MLLNSSLRPRWAARLLVPISMAALVLTVEAAVASETTQASAEAVQPSYVLPAKPSKMLRAPIEIWKPLLAQIGTTLDDRAKVLKLLNKPALIELNVQRTVLAQAQQDWPQVLDAVGRTRQLQDSESGRQLAGLLNEVLARQAIRRGDEAWLRRHLKEQVLAMPWAEVETPIRSLRQQLSQMSGETIEAYVTNRLDISTGVTDNRAALSFVMQLMAMRFQLLEVMPHRDALVAGLDEAIARRSPGVAASAASK